MSVRVIALALAAACAAVVAGCGEKQQVVVYKQGKYQGKPDSKPWETAAFGGDKAKWEAAIRARSQNQNEYKRM